MPSAVDYLLDTHVWVWLLERLVRRVVPSTRRTVSEAARHGRLKVSPISAWEVGMLVRKDRLAFNVPCHRWVERTMTVPGPSVAELTPAIAVESCVLPEEFHGASADRMLVASARAGASVLLTADEALPAYAKRGHVRAADCRV